MKPKVNSVQKRQTRKRTNQKHWVRHKNDIMAKRNSVKIDEDDQHSTKANERSTEHYLNWLNVQQLHEKQHDNDITTSLPDSHPDANNNDDDDDQTDFDNFLLFDKYDEDDVDQENELNDLESNPNDMDQVDSESFDYLLNEVSGRDYDEAVSEKTAIYCS